MRIHKTGLIISHLVDNKDSVYVVHITDERGVEMAAYDVSKNEKPFVYQGVGHLKHTIEMTLGNPTLYTKKEVPNAEPDDLG